MLAWHRLVAMSPEALVHPRLYADGQQHLAVRQLQTVQKSGLAATAQPQLARVRTAWTASRLLQPLARSAHQTDAEVDLNLVPAKGSGARQGKIRAKRVRVLARARSHAIRFYALLSHLPAQQEL